MKTGSFIEGQWFHPKSKRLIKNVNPADPKDIISEFPTATLEDVGKAIEAAKAAWPTWKNVPLPERGRILWRAADLSRQRADAIARCLTREEGKVYKEAMAEVIRGIAVLEYYSGEGYRMGGKTLPAEHRDVFSYTLRHSLGVVSLIAPFNFPWSIPAWKIAPALVAGNTVIFKPSEITSATAAMLIEIFIEAGVPPGVLNMIVGYGDELGDAMITSPEIKAISFTGSNRVGTEINVKAAKFGKKVTCEMGGKNAVVVLEDADLEKTCNAIIEGAFGSTGQRCTATSRILVDEKVKNDLLEILVEKAKKIKVGNGLDKDVDMGPAVTDAQLKKDFEYVSIAKNEGARLVTGGKKPDHTNSGGYFIEPTIFDNVEAKMRIFQEEVFGPVLSIVSTSNINEAIKFANSVQYGLSTAFFSNNLRAVMEYINEVEAGMIHINEPSIGSEVQLPFGGVKATAIGDRELADEGLNFFSETKTIFINYHG